MQMQQCEGLWQFDHAVPLADDGGRLHNSHFCFLVGEDYVVVQLPALRPLPRPREDDFYKLRAKMEDDKLLYQMTDGGWLLLAVYEDGRFTDTGNGIKRVFRKITADELVDWSKGLLNLGRNLERYD